MGEYKFKEEGEITEMLVNYFCLPLPACNASEVCKDVTVKPGQYIVNPKCLCENGLACPSVTKKGVTKTLKYPSTSSTPSACARTGLPVLQSPRRESSRPCQEPMRTAGID